MEPRCPRCGYDQSGAIATWADSCPVHGICPECGLEFDWCDVLDPERTVPEWSIESVGQRRVRRFRGTLFRLYFPNRFWRGIQMQHRARPLRIVFVGLVGAMASLAAGVAVSLAIRAFFNANYAWSTGRYLPSMLVGSVWDVVNYDRRGFWGIPIAPAYLVVLASWAIFPFGFLALWISVRRYRIRVHHLLRGQIYELPTFVLLAILPVVVLRIVEVLDYHFGSGRFHSITYYYAPWSTLLAVLIWHAWWWRATCRHYLRLPHAESVACALSIIAVISAFLLFLLPSVFL